MHVLDSNDRDIIRLSLNTAKSTGDPADVVAVIKAHRAKKAKGPTPSERSTGITAIRTFSPPLASSLTQKLNDGAKTNRLMTTDVTNSTLDEVRVLGEVVP